MKLKDLFKSTKAIKSSGLDDVAAELESQEYIKEFNEDKVRFMPNVDYSDPSNFAYYGSAEKYYTDAFERVKNLYPYDGSQKEKIEWLNDSTFLDIYIFEHRYPRFNGYINFSNNGWGTLNGSLIGGYGRSNTNEYIKTFGGPNQSNKEGLIRQFDDANKYATASLNTTASTPDGQFRESNLNYNLNGGVSLEMWLKKPAFDAAKTEKEVLFDLWNGEATNSAQYGRFTLELTGAATGSPFLLTAYSGTTGFAHESIGQNITKASITDWTHIAITAKNSGSDVALSFYVNGALNHTSSVSGINLGHVTGSMTSFIGALQAPTKANTTLQLGAGKFSGSIDEFRYWKTERTSKEIGRHYWTNIGAGTNTDEANTELGVYYKFNEGITGDAAIDAVVLDYSGRVSNGTWTGYSDGARSTSSAIVESSASVSEFKDPTIYSAHPDYISILGELEASGSLYDNTNNASLVNSIPSWISDEDNEKNGNLRNITQAMASYFDNLQLHIKELNSLKNVYAHFQTNTINTDNMTSITGSTKPLPFADRLLTNAGFVAPELFADATVLEALATRSEDEDYEMALHNIKNQIYQNVYSALINIYKRKGTNKSFRNILHSFGVDEDIVKINFYGDNVDFELNDRHAIRTTKQKFVDFNHPDRFGGTVYQYAQGTDSVNFITGSTANLEKYIPITFETQVILPNKIPFNETNGFETPFTKSVIAGMHQAGGSTYTIPGTDNCDIQMFTVRSERESKDVKFHLKSVALGIELTSSLYPNMYDNNEWLLAFRITNDKDPSVDTIAGSTTGDNYVVDFLGYNTEGTTLLNSFHLSSSVTAAKAEPFLVNSKRIYAGAKRENFTGSLQESSDHKIGFVRYWMNHLDNTTLLQHSYDSSNYGAGSPFRSAYLMQSEVNDIKIPEIDTLLLHWDFEILSTSDSSGKMFVTDTTSGSGIQRYEPVFENLKRKFYHGQADKFSANDEKAIDVVYINAAKVTFPDVLQGDDMIEIRQQDDLQFTRNTLPQDYFIAFEKSMAQTISEEMLKFMSSITDFNNLIGRPVDRYRMEYKDLRKLRELFFERISNEPDLDKYIDYYKWLDDALGEMLVALVPASLAHSDGINNVIENHVFDRDKYQSKFPTIEFKVPDLEGGMNTINRHLYPWKTGHAPITPQTAGKEDDNCFWWLERAERDKTPLSQSDAGVNNTRVKVFQARNSILNRSFTTAQHLDVASQKTLHGGTNYEHNKRRDYIWSATRDVSESPLDFGKFGGFPLRYILTNSDMYMSLKDCDDERPVTEKIKMAFGAYDGFNTFMHYHSGSHPDGKMKGGMVMPFNVMSSSALEGYSDLVEGLPGGATTNIDIVNLHSDTVDNTNAVPMQGPFTERWVGGHQSRHAPLNRGTDVSGSRAEGYRLLLGNILNPSGSIGIVGPDYPYPYANQTTHPFFYKHQPKARYFREERAKRPLNIKNIRTTLDSTKTITSDLVGGVATIYLGVGESSQKTTQVLATAIRSLFLNDVDSRFSEWTIGPVGNLSGGKGFTVEAPTDSEVYNFENVTTNLSDDIITTVTNGNLGGTKSKLQIVVNSTLLTIANNATWSFQVDMNGIDGQDTLETFTLTFKTAAGTDDTGWKEASSTVTNIKIGSVIGNFQKNYQPVHTFNRSAQKSRLRDLDISTNVHNATNSALPQTTQEASVIARGIGSKKGNLMSNFHTSSLYLSDVKTSKAAYVDHEASGSGESIIVNRFSAPGGFETMSEVFLNLYGKEKSAYNALPFRNLSVLTDSGEAGVERVVDIHGNRKGLRTHLTRHASQFGIDSVVGDYPTNELPSFHKTNRNSKFFKSETTTTPASDPTATATLFDNANAQRETTAAAIRNLFASDTNFNSWNIGALITTNQNQDGARFTITAPSTGTQYDFSNLSDAIGNINGANEIDTTATSGASSPATLKITVMGRPHELDGRSITFDVKPNGTGTSTRFTLNFTNAAGTNSTVWTHTAGSSSSTSTTNKYRYDNGYVTHQIPQSDYQYQWVSLSHTASYATSSLSRHILSKFSERSGTTSTFPHEDLNVVVHSQSCLSWFGNYVGSNPAIARIDHITAYGFPSWEQVRNNDKNTNNILKKDYGYNILKTTTIDPLPVDPSGTTIKTVSTFEESRMTENINNSVTMRFQGSNFEFKYPYVNMRYHFDNKNVREETNLHLNETLYDSLYGFYSQGYGITNASVEAKNIRQIIFPRHIKHTKYFDRHRHFFVSHFWTDGENDNYNNLIGLFGLNETGSYNRLDELGRRETSLTATLFGTSSLNSQASYMINDLNYLTNIIPSQSIWSMDSRTYFTGGASTTLAGATTGLSTTGWDPVAAASNSAGAPGVLQNQDHHFHNGVSDIQLLRSGSGATGSFQAAGATRFGTGATGSFEVLGATSLGSAATSSFTSIGRYEAAASASMTFTAKGESIAQYADAAFTVLGQGSRTSGEFTFLEGAAAAGAAARLDFTAKNPIMGKKAGFSFDVSANFATEGDFIQPGQNGNTTNKVTIDYDNAAASTKVSPVEFQKAIEIQGTDSFTGAVPGNSTFCYTYEFLIKPVDGLHATGGDVILYTSANSNGDDVIRIYLNGSNQDLYVEHHFQNNTVNAGAKRIWRFDAPFASIYDTWAHLRIYVGATNIVEVHVNNTELSVRSGFPVYQGFSAGDNTVNRQSSTHKIAGDGSTAKNKPFAISNFSIHHGDLSTATDRTNFRKAAYRYNFYGANTATYGTVAGEPAYHLELQPLFQTTSLPTGVTAIGNWTFGDGTGDTANNSGAIDDTNSAESTYNLTNAFASNRSFVDSKYANRHAQPTTYYNQIKDELTTMIGTNFDVTYDVQQVKTTQDEAAPYLNVNGDTIGCVPGGSNTYPIKSDHIIGVASFKIVSKSKSALSAHQLHNSNTTVSNTDTTSGARIYKRSFPNLVRQEVSSVADQNVTSTTSNTDHFFHGRQFSIPQASAGSGARTVGFKQLVPVADDPTQTSNQYVDVSATTRSGLGYPGTITTSGFGFFSVHPTASAGTQHGGYYDSTNGMGAQDNVTFSYWYQKRAMSTAEGATQEDMIVSVMNTSSQLAYTILHSETAIVIKIYDNNPVNSNTFKTWSLNYTTIDNVTGLDQFDATQSNHYFISYDQKLGESQFLGDLELFVNGISVTAEIDPANTNNSGQNHRDHQSTAYGSLFVAGFPTAKIECNGVLSDLAIYEEHYNSSTTPTAQVAARAMFNHGYSFDHTCWDASDKLVHWWRIFQDWGVANQGTTDGQAVHHNGGSPSNSNDYFIDDIAGRYYKQKLQIRGTSKAVIAPSHFDTAKPMDDGSANDFTSAIETAIDNLSGDTGFTASVENGANGTIRITSTTAGTADNGISMAAVASPNGASLITGLTATTANGTANTGLGVGADVTLKLRKGDDYTSGVLDNTSDAVHIVFKDDSTATTATNSSYSTNPVIINVTDAAHDTDEKLYNKIKEAIDNHSLLRMTATRGTGNDSNKITVTSVGTGGGSSKFYTNDQPSQVTRSPNNTGGNGGTGARNNDYVQLDNRRFILDSEGRSNNAGVNPKLYYIDATNSDPSALLEASINANAAWTVQSRSGDPKELVIKANNFGTAANNDLTVNGTSFNITDASGGGVNETGTVDDHWVDIKIYDTDTNGSPATYKVRADAFNDHNTANSPYYAVDGDTLYVNSRQSDTNFWNTIEAALESRSDGSGNNLVVTQGSDNPRTFTVQSYIPGTRGNTPSSVTGNQSGNSFNHANQGRFSGGTAGVAGAADGDQIRITEVGGTQRTFTVKHLATGVNATNFQFKANVSDSEAFWTEVRDKITNNVAGATCTMGTDEPRTFTVKTSSPFVAHNFNISAPTNTAPTFASVSNTAGTAASGAEPGDTITIDSEVFEIYNGSSFSPSTAGNHGVQAQNAGGTLTTAQFHSNLKTTIEAQTRYDVTVAASDTDSDGYFDIVLNNDTNTTGSTQNQSVTSALTIAKNSAGSRETFGTIVQMAGALDEEGAKAGDKIKIANPSPEQTTFQEFTVVAKQHDDGTLTANEIGAGNPASTRNQNGNRSSITDVQFWDQIEAKIKAITGGANSVTSSFVVGNLDNITRTVNSNTASFTLKSQRAGYTDPFTNNDIVTGSDQNGTITTTSTRTFHSPQNLTGGFDGVFRDIKYQEIIPQPRYNYPHALQSPGSMRCPTAKSNLGLIDVNYKLRSNHFALTRSLGKVGTDDCTDGLYDNTSRWTTPDLSGLTPMDDSYNEWYERHRGQNKHFSLVPEYRVSSHVEGIINTGMNEQAYFSKNYWLELTGASFDDGTTVAKNQPRNSEEAKNFLLEYSTTSNIRNIENFITDNSVSKVGLEPLKLTLTCEAINSFLPYEGFYPQTRTVQMCEAFAKSYGNEIEATEADPNDTTLTFPDNNPLAQTRPVFDAIMSPGLLYNTIKSGIAVDYPVVMSKMATASLKDPYGGTNHMIDNEYFEGRLPFETLLEPEAHMSKKYLVDMNPHPSSSMNLKAKIGNATDPNYKLMSNNFFAETMQFFLQDGQSSKIISKPDTDPNFGVVVPITDGVLPIYKSIFRVFKSKKKHPYIEFSGAADVVRLSENPDRAEDLYYNRPPSGTNYFLREYVGLTGSALEYDINLVNYPRPNMNPYAEVETITMYSQPNAFGPPCAGGVTVEYAGRNESDVAQTGANNNTTYMMYDSTNGYNSPFTPPYYDGEAWVIYTFVPQRSGKHSLDEIMQNTKTEYLRYELNHESGSFGDRGTSGPQGFSINDNAMQADASFNLFKKVALLPREPSSFAGRTAFPTLIGSEGNTAGSTAANSVISETSIQQQPQRAGICWAIESKFETPILDFSKYLNRDYNAVFEADTTTDDIHTANLSLSGTRDETPSTAAHRLQNKLTQSSLASVHLLSGTLNPIGMWHQHGEFPVDPDKGIFMQMVDVPASYLQFGTEMTIPNPKWITVKPNIVDCDGDTSALAEAYNQNSIESLLPYLPKQENRRRLDGIDEFAVKGGAIQVINPDTGIIIDTELRDTDLKSAFGVDIVKQTGNGRAAYNNAVVDGFKLFDVFRDSSLYTKNILTTHNDFKNTAQKVFIGGVDKSSVYSNASNSDFQGHWAASYYHYDQPAAYAPLLIVTKDYEGLKYDYGDFSRGFFEEFLSDFSIGKKYREQSPRFSDGEDVSCTKYTPDSNRSPTVFAPKVIVDALQTANDTLTITNLSKIDMTSDSRAVVSGLLSRGIEVKTVKPTREAEAIAKAKTTQKSATVFRNLTTRRLGLIPPHPAATTTAGSSTDSYNFSEPMFVRGAIKYNAGNAVAGSDDGVTMRNLTYFKQMPQFAPQNDNNITSSPSTIRWGRFMHNNLDPKNVKSLADLVGFSQAPVKMGITSKSRVISEAVVAMPYILRDSNPDSTAGDQVPEFVQLDPVKVILHMLKLGLISEEEARERLEEFMTTESQDLTSDSSRSKIVKKLVLETSPDGSLIVETSEETSAPKGTPSMIAPSAPDTSKITLQDPAVIDQIDKMGKYVFPPHIDFLNYDVTPLAMYIFEFTRTLDRGDLNDLWQGVRSENVKKVEMQKKSITHSLDVNSLLGSVKLGNPDLTDLKDIKWRIFKVKRRANTNYDEKMNRDIENLGYITEQSVTKINQPKIGYNWPYDYFSLVENVKLKVDIELSKPPEEEKPEADVDYSGIPAGDLDLAPEIIGSNDDDSGYIAVPVETLPRDVLTEEGSNDAKFAETFIPGVFGLIPADTTPDSPGNDTGGTPTPVPKIGGRGTLEAIAKPEDMETEAEVQGSGDGSGYGGAGGGGVGQGTDGVDDDY